MNLSKEQKMLIGAMFLSSVKEEQFDMTNFTDSNNETETTCGTVGCAAGNLSWIFEKKYEEDWVNFSERLFGKITKNSDGWGYLFDGGWVHYDNTPYGAAQRIVWLFRELKENGSTLKEIFRDSEGDYCPDDSNVDDEWLVTAHKNIDVEKEVIRLWEKYFPGQNFSEIYNRIIDDVPSSVMECKKQP